MKASIAIMGIRRTAAWLGLAQLLLLLAACDHTTPAPTAGNSTNSSSARAGHYSYEIIHTYPHDRRAFTQGLIFLDGYLYESTGLNGQSSVRKVDLTTGKVLEKTDVPFQYFAEGLAALNGKLYQLTWQQNTAFVYDLNTFNRELLLSYRGEGWGLTTDGQSLIMSDGTDELRFLDPSSFQIRRTVRVRDHGEPVSELNELEFVKGEIYANVWKTDHIVRINPATGEVLGDINLTGLLAPGDRDDNTDVLNGIAYDAAGDRLFVTGKNWPKLFEIRLKPE